MSAPADEDHILTPAQQKRLNEKKVETRIENERYLRKHPELKVMLDLFLAEVLDQRPSDIKAFAARFFCDPNLAQRVSDAEG